MSDLIITSRYMDYDNLRFRAMHSKLSMIKLLRNSFSFMYNEPSWRYILKYGSYDSIKYFYKKYIL